MESETIPWGSVSYIDFMHIKEFNYDFFIDQFS